MRAITYLAVVLFLFGCSDREQNPKQQLPQKINTPYIKVLGIAQDAGYPQIGCKKKCCSGSITSKYVASIALVTNSGYYLFDATSDITHQVKMMGNELPKGIFLTHGHIGHYTGLMYLGREAIGAQQIPVYCMPRMQNYLAGNGPWSQLIELENILIKPIDEESIIELEGGIKVNPFLVPHRDEFTETVGYKIFNEQNSLIYIPDIDKWSKWEKNLVEVIKQNTYVLIDGTFYDNNELPGRDMSEIPHPFVVETMELLKDLPDSEKKKVYFIHLNHTNPLINPNSVEYKNVNQAGFNIATQEQTLRIN